MSTKELKELQVSDWPSDTESYELLDKECLKRETTVYVNWLDPFAEGQDKVQGIDRAGEAGGDVLRIQIGAVRGNCVKDKGECEQQRYLNYNNTTKWVRTNRWTDTNQGVLCRLVAQELTYGEKMDELLAGTPPRIHMKSVVHYAVNGGLMRGLMLLAVKCPFWCWHTRRAAHIGLSRQDQWSACCNGTMYEDRGAPQIW